MPEVTTYAPGTPCWVDLSTADVERAVGFYNAVLGWEPASAEEAEEIGGLVACRIRGLNVAAIAALGDTNQPPGWTTYIATADAEATCARVQDAGGEVLLDPGDVGMMGRLSVCADPQQAVFGLWQPGEVAGAQLVGEHGANTWDDLTTLDPEAARAFYEDVFGWHADPTTIDGAPYTTFALEPGGPPITGIAEAPPGTRPHWGVCFGARDVDAATATAVEFGAAIQMGPEDAQFGRFVALTDPQGALFSLMTTADAG